MKKDWTKKCTCENFQQNEDCEHIGNKVLEEVGMQVEDSMGSYHIANTHIGKGESVDIGIKDGCGQPMLMKRIDTKNDLYLEPLNFDFNTASVVSDLYMFQQSINNIIKVLNKITKSLKWITPKTI